MRSAVARASASSRLRTTTSPSSAPTRCSSSARSTSAPSVAWPVHTFVLQQRLYEWTVTTTGASTSPRPRSGGWLAAEAISTIPPGNRRMSSVVSPLFELVLGGPRTTANHLGPPTSRDARGGSEVPGGGHRGIPCRMGAVLPARGHRPGVVVRSHGSAIGRSRSASARPRTLGARHARPDGGASAARIGGHK